jgi:membrane-associated phospholipid phosphatase
LATAVGLVGLVVTASIAAAGSPGSAEVAVFRWFNDPPGAVTVGVIVGAWPWLNRPWKVGGVLAAAAIGLNRMYVGAHFLSTCSVASPSAW